MDGFETLKNRLPDLPAAPGVYRMLNTRGDVLYVGKAKNLKNRVSQYTQPERLVQRIKRMVFETADLQIVETATEAEALLLEANLIKSLKPRYNVRLTDDSSYLGILFTKHDTPRLVPHRGARQKAGQYFGPYPNGEAVRRTIDTLERVFQLRTCKDTVFINRTRPCLKYDIKRCCAPCVGKVSPQQYAERVKQARLFLQGQSKTVQSQLQQDMLAAAEKQDFEQAAQIRDRLQALQAITGESGALTHGLKTADVFALVLEGGKAVVQAYIYRNGQHVNNQLYHPVTAQEDDPAVVMSAFLAQYYAGRTPPGQIYVNLLPTEAAMLHEALSTREGKKIRISMPQRGEKAKILAQAEHNARQTLQRKLAETQNWSAQMATLADILALANTIQRVECFDVSNISGKQAVCSMVVAENEGMNKKQYRLFKIQSKDTPDDYAMMHEALTRRYSRLLNEQAALPDVILVDGGRGHLSTLIQVMQTLDLLDTPACPALCAIAKGLERDKGKETIFQYKHGGTHVLPIPHQTPLIFVLQRIRDEAHRFAIGAHRNQRGKALTQSTLDGIPNIGGKRKKALLLHFGSPQAVKEATVEQLAQVPGISRALAQDIWGWFRG